MKEKVVGAHDARTGQERLREVLQAETQRPWMQLEVI